MRTKQEVIHAFTPVGKLDPGATQRLLRMEVSFRDMANEIMDHVPESADRTAALRKLLESKMTCIQAISHATNGPVQTPNTLAAPQQEKQNDKEKVKNK